MDVTRRKYSDLAQICETAGTGFCLEYSSVDREVPAQVVLAGVGICQHPAVFARCRGPDAGAEVIETGNLTEIFVPLAFDSMIINPFK